METLVSHSGIGGWFAPAAYIVFLTVGLSVVSLLALHVFSPEYAPSWRMVSEYANGNYSWLLSVVFYGWAASSLALTFALWPLSATTLGKVGLVFLILASVGQAMGGLFDINHKFHGPAAMIGIPSLCIAAVVLTIALTRFNAAVAPPLWSAHLPWISFVLMLASFALFISALKATGLEMSAQTGPLKELPVGVSGYVGWANRFLFASSYLWSCLAALAAFRAST